MYYPTISFMMWQPDKVGKRSNITPHDDVIFGTPPFISFQSLDPAYFETISWCGRTSVPWHSIPEKIVFTVFHSPPVLPGLKEETTRAAYTPPPLLFPSLFQKNSSRPGRQGGERPLAPVSVQVWCSDGERQTRVCVQIRRGMGVPRTHLRYHIKACIYVKKNWCSSCFTD